MLTPSRTMKKIIASAGILAFGAGAIHAVNYGDLSPDESSKRWSVSLGLRGFYDDNYATAASGSLKQSSPGMQVNPIFSINQPGGQTYLGAKLDYSMLYYFDRPGDAIDHNISLDLKLDHRFSEKSRIRVEDLFTYSKEPALLDKSGTVTTPVRSNADAIRNFLPIEYSWQLTRLFSLEFGYQNVFYDYLDSGPNSYSSRLDRLEHLLHVDARWQLQPHTVGLVGYAVGLINYTSGETIVPATPTSAEVTADDRNNFSQYIYVGAEHDFSADLSLALKIGANFNNYYNVNQSDISPYLDLALNWTYLPGDVLRFGVKQAHNSTDVVSGFDSAGEITLDQDTTTIYGSISHRITPKLTAGLLAQFQHSIYTGGTYSGEVDDFLNFGLSLTYKLSRNWSADLEYDFDYLTSSFPDRGYTRNRVYAGVRFVF